MNTFRIFGRIVSFISRGIKIFAFESHGVGGVDGMIKSFMLRLCVLLLAMIRDVRIVMNYRYVRCWKQSSSMLIWPWIHTPR